MLAAMSPLLKLKSASFILAASLCFLPIPFAPLTLEVLCAVLAALGRVSVAIFSSLFKLCRPNARLCAPPPVLGNLPPCLPLVLLRQQVEVLKLTLKLN